MHDPTSSQVTSFSNSPVAQGRHRQASAPSQAILAEEMLPSVSPETWQSIEQPHGPPEQKPPGNINHCSGTATTVTGRRGGGGLRSGSVKSNREKLRENWGAVTKSEASKSKTSAQGTHRAPTSTRGGQTKSNCGKIADNCEELQNIAPLCDSPSGCCSFPTGPWTVTRASLRMLRRVAAFCRPLRPVLLLVLFPRSRSPVVGVLGLC